MIYGFKWAQWVNFPWTGLLFKSYINNIYMQLKRVLSNGQQVRATRWNRYSLTLQFHYGMVHLLFCESNMWSFLQRFVIGHMHIWDIYCNNGPCYNGIVGEFRPITYRLQSKSVPLVTFAIMYSKSGHVCNSSQCVPAKRLSTDCVLFAEIDNNIEFQWRRKVPIHIPWNWATNLKRLLANVTCAICKRYTTFWTEWLADENTMFKNARRNTNLALSVRHFGARRHTTRSLREVKRDLNHVTLTPVIHIRCRGTEHKSRHVCKLDLNCYVLKTSVMTA